MSMLGLIPLVLLADGFYKLCIACLHHMAATLDRFRPFDVGRSLILSH
jgi:hypothetical protein